VALDSPEQYCREVEAYLCRKNDGHLIRIVGPAFEQVLSWAARGIPLRIACAGIDRYFERYYAKGPRRRPVRIEFCEADVLDVFDQWRRAVGVPAESASAGAAGEGGPTEPPSRSRASLPAHLDRVVARLTALRGGPDRTLDPALDRIVQELDGYRSSSRAIRGESRLELLERLRALDGELVASARDTCDPATMLALEADAAGELAPFRARLSEEVFEHARHAAVDRLIRQRRRLPTIAFD